MTEKFVTIPPDSSGKNVGVEERTSVEFDNQTFPFFIGDTVTGVASGITGVITGIVFEGFAANAGKLILRDLWIDHSCPISPFLRSGNVSGSGSPPAADTFIRPS